MNYKALPFIVLILSIFLHNISFGQDSKAFKYQAVARDGTGYPIMNEDVGLQIKIYSIIGGNVNDYVENHFVTTNDFGLINIDVGNGEIVEGDFQSINWGAGNHFIEISIDPTGGMNFVFMGSSEILSVPIASYAAKAGNVVDTSATNEFQKISLDHQHNLQLNPDGDMVNLALYYNLDEIDSLGHKISEDSIYFENQLEDLNLAIQNEIIRATEAENDLAELINQNADQILTDSIYFQNLIDGLNVGGNDDSLYFQTLIDANTLAIQQEVTRAILAEAINASNISLNANMINQLQNDLINDSAYLKGLIDQNSNAIAAEITRAISAELQNSNDIAQNTAGILENANNILSDSIYFKNLTDQIDFYLQEEITRATYRDETMSDSIIYLYAKQISDSIHFQNQINGLSGGGLDPTLENGKIFVGNNSNIATGVYLSGDALITNTGVMLINPNAITTNKIANGQVTNDKLASSSISISDNTGNSGQINLGNNLSLEAIGAANVTYDNAAKKISFSATDNQILTVSGSDLSISSGNSVDLSAVVGQTGPQGPQGPAGNDGIGVQSTVNNGDGTFTITYSDGSTFTSADLTGPQGPQGPVGPQGAIGPAGNDGIGVVSTVDNGDGTFTITYSDGSTFTSSDLTGPQGPIGLTGPQGPQGIQGIQGPAGADGTNGSDGVGVQSTVENGDGTFTITYTDGSSFTSADLTGPQGSQGPQGPIGPQGVIGPQGNDGVGVQSTVDNGDGTFTITYTDGSTFTSTDLTGPQGVQGDQGIQGPTGPQGVQGDQGIQGPAGNDGVSINWYGTVFPAPSSPNLNDGYHDPVQEKSFIWNGAAWVTIAEDGSQGPQGPTGPQGPAGTSLRDCPSTGSWSQINEEFCIEVNENTADTWWNAAKYCGDQNAHLCSWQEWYYVCQKSGSGTINMTNDWEWTGEGQTGSPSTATIVGNGSCTGSSTESMSNSNTFRCCFSR